MEFTDTLLFVRPLKALCRGVRSLRKEEILSVLLVDKERVIGHTEFNCEAGRVQGRKCLQDQGPRSGGTSVDGSYEPNPTNLYTEDWIPKGRHPSRAERGGRRSWWGTSQLVHLPILWSPFWSYQRLKFTRTSGRLSLLESLFVLFLISKISKFVSTVHRRGGPAKSEKESEVSEGTPGAQDRHTQPPLGRKEWGIVMEEKVCKSHDPLSHKNSEWVPLGPEGWVWPPLSSRGETLRTTNLLPIHTSPSVVSLHTSRENFNEDLPSLRTPWPVEQV